jgi:putative phosphoribosyl transferase
MDRFKNRTEAGRLLAEKLKNLPWEGTCILALPRGGVPVAAEVARILKIPWDLLLVKKIESPMQPEFAIGAIAEDDEPIWNEEARSYIPLSEIDKDYLTKQAREKMQFQNETWKAFRKPINVENKTVLLVDDGLATGLTMKAAVKHLQLQHAKRIVVAIPVAPKATKPIFTKLVHRYIVLMEPTYFSAVGEWYEDFSQVSDEEVLQQLNSRK